MNANHLEIAEKSIGWLKYVFRTDNAASMMVLPSFETYAAVAMITADWLAGAHVAMALFSGFSVAENVDGLIMHA